MKTKIEFVDDDKPTPPAFWIVCIALIVLSVLQEHYYPDLIHPVLKAIIVVLLLLPFTISIDIGGDID